MTELDIRPELETEDLSDELCDEALDRAEGDRFCCQMTFHERV